MGNNDEILGEKESEGSGKDIGKESEESTADNKEIGKDSEGSADESSEN